MSEHRQAIRRAVAGDEGRALKRLQEIARLEPSREAAVWQRSRELVLQIRDHQQGQGGIDALLQEFSLSSEEGVVLMCLAEALLRIPDAATQDRMIQDRLGSGDWTAHLGHSESLFVNASAWGLLLTGKVTGLSAKQSANVLSRTVGRLGEPVIRSAMRYAMQIMGAQFVMGTDIRNALVRARRFEKMGYAYSYDMLGEGARTMVDADRYFAHYLEAIDQIGRAGGHGIGGAGISIKLSALHPRYELKQHGRVLRELRQRLMQLVLAAKRVNIGLTVDAEESFRLDLSLEIIESVFSDERLAGWNGFGLAIQAYQKHGYEVVEWAVNLARETGRRLSVRLVKGAYWDSEIKWAQEKGHETYPVFTEKCATDVSYQACARLLLDNRAYVYPQFATHNAYTLAAILEMEQQSSSQGDFEFQRLHGMGEELYDDLVRAGTRCRIYAPVGEHADLLAYLVRRLLENGANTSFVNNIQNRALPLSSLLEDPVRQSDRVSFRMPLPADIYWPHRANSRGLDLEDLVQLSALAGRLPLVELSGTGQGTRVVNPACLSDSPGQVRFDDKRSMLVKLERVAKGRKAWQDAGVPARAEVLRRIAAHLEAERHWYIACCLREAGKTLDDCVGEVREAIDFCHYYAEQAALHQGEALGTVLCISPWNFPLAIFLGQVAAALVTGNTVIAKPAEQTSLVALKLVREMYNCGVPEDALQLVISEGRPVSEVLVSDARINGVMFTGSTETAKTIARVLDERAGAGVPLVAETGGMNAMIVDSTALAEQVVDDVVYSCFHSAGQRCSALRLLYVQADVADEMVVKISGKMQELKVGNPGSFATDVGPVIDERALARLEAHIRRLDQHGAKLIYRTPVDAENGHYFAPAFYELDDLSLLTEEVFGPVLHLRRFRAAELESVVQEINSTGYGLTFGMHSRIERRTEMISRLVRAGNIYINRNMVGAIVGVQPFGGRGRSGTGPKAGGPNYLPALLKSDSTDVMAGEDELAVCFGQFDEAQTHAQQRWEGRTLEDRTQQLRLMLVDWLATHPAIDGNPILEAFRQICEKTAACSRVIRLPSPTGERDTLLWQARGVVCVVTSEDTAASLLLLLAALVTGNVVMLYDEQGLLAPLAETGGGLIRLTGTTDLGTQAVAMPQGHPALAYVRTRLLEDRDELVPVISDCHRPMHFMVEKVVSVNTTAAGGNASLMAGRDAA